MHFPDGPYFGKVARPNRRKLAQSTAITICTYSGGGEWRRCGRHTSFARATNIRIYRREDVATSTEHNEQGERWPKGGAGTGEGLIHWVNRLYHTDAAKRGRESVEDRGKVNTGAKPDRANERTRVLGVKEAIRLIKFWRVWETRIYHTINLQLGKQNLQGVRWARVLLFMITLALDWIWVAKRGRGCGTQYRLPPGRVGGGPTRANMLRRAALEKGKLTGKPSALSAWGPGKAGRRANNRRKPSIPYWANPWLSQPGSYMRGRSKNGKRTGECRPRTHTSPRIPHV